jgi:dTDP-4-dehydrorhamnose 3,5-epimerase
MLGHKVPMLIKGGRHIDERGKLAFINDFSMASCKRFYQITHDKTDLVRAWQGHKAEAKWFYCIKGSFDIKLIKIDNWNSPSKKLLVQDFIIDENQTEVLYIPPGYVNGFRAIEEGASIIVYSDATLKDSQNDDIRFDKDYWQVW